MTFPGALPQAPRTGLTSPSLTNPQLPKDAATARHSEPMAKTKSATKITPLGDRVLLQRVEAEETTKGGIILPETAKEKPREGIVLALGSGRVLKDGTRAEFSVKTKDRVLFSSYAGTEVKVDGQEYIILGEEEILAIVG